MHYLKPVDGRFFDIRLLRKTGLFFLPGIIATPSSCSGISIAAALDSDDKSVRKNDFPRLWMLFIMIWLNKYKVNCYVSDLNN